MEKIKGAGSGIILLLALVLIIAILGMMPKASITGGGCVYHGLGSEISVIEMPSGYELQKCGPTATIQLPMPNDKSIEFSMACQGSQQTFIPVLLVRDWARSPEGSGKPIYYEYRGATVPRLQGSQYFNARGEIEVFVGALASREVAGWICTLEDIHTTTLFTPTPNPAVFPFPSPSPVSGTPVRGGADRIPLVSDIWDLVLGIFNEIVLFIAIPFLPP